MRLFIAMGFGEDIVGMLEKKQAEAAACGQMKAVEAENLHITLKFLGEVSADKVGSIKRALAVVDSKKFEAEVKGVGVFPNPGNAKVVWAGITRGFDEAVALSKAIDAALAPLGFPPEDRFHPHITLARVKGQYDREKLKSLLKTSADTVFGRHKVGCFDLMESRLTPKGPVYTKLDSYLLG